MGHRIVKVPPAGDCFFHVVALFFGRDPQALGPALEFRQAMASEGAQAIFAMSLEELSQRVLTAESADDLPDPLASVDAQLLAGFFGEGPDADNTNGGGVPLAVWIFWLQFSVAEIATSIAVPQWLFQTGTLPYTLWGDDLFVMELTERVTGMRTRVFTTATIGDIDDAVAINFYYADNHFDAAFHQVDDAPVPVEISSSSEASTSSSEDGEERDWQYVLEIHHIDVDQGDCTLVLFRYSDGGIAHSVLIDGGKGWHAPGVHMYLESVGIQALDIAVITHYDNDHYGGVLQLLAYSSLCVDTRIFDRGETDKKHVRHKLRKARKGKHPTESGDLVGIPESGFQLGSAMDLEVDTVMAFDSKREEGESGYDSDEDEAGYESEAYPTGTEVRVLEFEKDGAIYFRRIERSLGARERMTQGMTGHQPLGRTIMSIEGVASLRCIAVNGHVLNGAFVEPRDDDIENASSIALLLEFNGFTYYCGGDTPGVEVNNTEGAIGAYLEDVLGLDHVCAMKCSHHGSHKSTKADFVGAIRPTVAFITCGRGDHLHPRQPVLTALADHVQNVYLSNCIFKREQIRPLGKLQSGQARVAGDERTLGTTVLRVFESTAADHVFHVGYWDREAACWRLIRHECTDDANELLTALECCSSGEELSDTPESSEQTGEGMHDYQPMAVDNDDDRGGEESSSSEEDDDQFDEDEAAVDAAVFDERNVRGVGCKRTPYHRGTEKSKPPAPEPKRTTYEDEALVEAAEAKAQQEAEQTMDVVDERDGDWNG